VLLKNISRRTVQLLDANGVAYIITAGSELSMPNSLLADTTFKKTLSFRTRDLIIIPGAAVKVYNNANISISNTTLTAVTFNSEFFDTDNMHSTSVNTGRLTVASPGKYWFQGSAEFAANATGIRGLEIRLNGATTVSKVYQNATSTGTTNQNVSVMHDMAVNDYMELLVYQSSTASLNLNYTTPYSPTFSAVLQGA
jgi:hypothetical protein